jgi:hypothetical protein
MKDMTKGAPRRATLIAGVAALGLALAPTAVTPPGAHALPVQGARRCTPGKIKVVGGQKYVCDKHGKWIKVLNLTAGASRVRVTAVTGVLR